VGSRPPATRGDRIAKTQACLYRDWANFYAIPGTIHGADGTVRCPPGPAIVNAPRRLSQAISEGDGISLLVPVDDADAARAAEQEGAEGVVVNRALEGLREATGLPVLSRLGGASAAVQADADACLLWVETAGNGMQLRDLHSEAEALGVEPVIGVRDDEELALALEQVDPEILLLSARAEDGDEDEDPLEPILDLLPDVPAGKLAIAEVAVRTREDVVALELAGVDAVIVRPGDVARLVGGLPPEV
jgi:hypothetical protein